jgi:hypothetical protein
MSGVEAFIAVAGVADAVVVAAKLIDTIITTAKEIKHPGLKRRATAMETFLKPLKAKGLPRMEKELKDDPEVFRDIEAALLELEQVVKKMKNKSRTALVVYNNAYRAEMEQSAQNLRDLMSNYQIYMHHEVIDEVRKQREDAAADRRDLQELKAKAQELAGSDSVSGTLREAASLLVRNIDQADDLDEVAARLDEASSRDTLVNAYESFAATFSAQQTIHATFTESDVRVDEDSILGQGAFGQVLKGAIVKTGEAVAIKRIPYNPDLINFRESEKLLTEAQLWETLKHPNIVDLKGTCMMNNRLLLVMELCDLSLHELLYGVYAVKAPLQTEDHPMILRGIARGMAFLHQNNIVHRDIKPANILISRDRGKVMLADFGLAAQKSGSTSHAKTVSVAGSPCYMAPEVLQVPAVWTTRADVYSFGITVWEMLHKRSPWPENVHRDAMINKILREGFIPEIDEDVASVQWVVRLIASCCRRDPKDRPYAAKIATFIEKKTHARRSTRALQGIMQKAQGRVSMVPNEKKEKGVGDIEEGLRESRSVEEGSPVWWLQAGAILCTLIGISASSVLVVYGYFWYAILIFFCTACLLSYFGGYIDRAKRERKRERKQNLTSKVDGIWN